MSPIAGDIWGLQFIVEGRPRPQPARRAEGDVSRVVFPGYFQRCGCRFCAGATSPRRIALGAPRRGDRERLLRAALLA